MTDDDAQEPPTADLRVSREADSLGDRSWPAHRFMTVPWKSATRGNREDRMLSEIDVSLPPFIADLHLYPEPATVAAIDRATQAVTELDAGVGASLASLGTFLIRSEAVSSSRIENVRASQKDFAKAIAGVKASNDAIDTLAAVTAIEAMVGAADETGEIRLEDVLMAHRRLMENNFDEKRYAGRLRSMQNWILGHDASPIGAIHIPPPPGMVQAYMDDLLVYANRDDLPPIVQAAVAHAQFESIHPFTDGNGRIGRALISAVLRRRGLTKRTVVPIASAMLANTQRYFELVNNYRTGAAEEFVRYVAEAAVVASREAAASGRQLEKLPELWTSLAVPRSGSADQKIIAILLAHPVLDVAAAAQFAGVSLTSAADALKRLTAATVLEPITASKRNNAWAATVVLDEIDTMNARIGVRR